MENSLSRALACMAFATVLSVITPEGAVAQRPTFGPFATRDQFPIKLMFLSLRPDGAALLPKGAVRLSGRLAYENTFAVTGFISDPRVPATYFRDAPLDAYRLFVDAEVLRIELDADWRPSRWMQVGLELPLITQSGGFLDRTIEGFHGLFNLPNGGREQASRNAYGIYVARDGRFFVARNDAASIRLSDVVLRVKSPILARRGRRPAVSWSGALKLPTGDFDDITGSGGTDAQLALLISERLHPRFAVHYNVAYTWIGQPSRHAGFPVQNVTSQLLAFEYLATRRLSVLMQVLANTSLFPEGSPIDRTAYGINGGVKYALTRSTLFEAGLLENLSQYHNTPDFGLQLGLSIRR